MRTSAQQPVSTGQATSATASYLQDGQSRKRSLLPDLPNRSALPSAGTDDGYSQDNPTMDSPRSGHDFSRIAVHDAAAPLPGGGFGLANPLALNSGPPTRSNAMFPAASVEDGNIADAPKESDKLDDADKPTELSGSYAMIAEDKPKTSSDPTWGYVTKISYTVLKGSSEVTGSVGVKEKWASGQVNDYPGCDWSRDVEHNGATNGSKFTDKIQGELSGRTPSPQKPASPLGSTKVQHWTQEWYIAGQKVQTNRLQKYLDHAAHEDIK